MVSRFFLILFLVHSAMSVAAAAEPKIVAGNWKAQLETPGGPISFDLKMVEEGDEWTATIMNPSEPLEIPTVKVSGKNLRLNFDHYDSEIAAELNDGHLVGRWTKQRGGSVAELKFTAMLGEPTAASASEFQPFVGRWSVAFSESDDESIGQFSVNKSGSPWGTFLTTTGDYRFLAVQSIAPKEARLSCFDGSHAFLFALRKTGANTMQGDFWSGGSWHETFTAERNEKARLPDAFQQTTVLRDVDLKELRFPNLEGKKTRLLDEKFAAPCRIIQIFGSWCPNCHDAARYLKELKMHYGDDVSILGLAFEHTGDFDRDVAQVKRYLQRHDAPYKVLLAGTSDKAKATEQIKFLDRVRSYPTTIFLNEQGEIQATYTGFSGPATGEAHETLKRQFRQTIDRVLQR